MTGGDRLMGDQKRSGDSQGKARDGNGRKCPYCGMRLRGREECSKPGCRQKARRPIEPTEREKKP